MILINFFLILYWKIFSLKQTWTEEQDDELRRLFMEHRENQLEDGT